jgi:hypothetical protein
MVLEGNYLTAFRQQADWWLEKYGCFSVSRLFDAFRGSLRHVRTVETCAEFLQYLGYRAEFPKKAGPFCVFPSKGLGGALDEVAGTIAKCLEESGGALALQQIEEDAPHLSQDALEDVRARMVPEAYRTNINGMPCWCIAGAIALPDDFSAKLADIVGRLEATGKKVTVASLANALDLFYGVRFREEHGLSDDDAFKLICNSHCQGQGQIFASVGRPRKSTDALGDARTSMAKSAGYGRRGPTRFHDIGVPIGADSERNAVPLALLRRRGEAPWVKRALGAGDQSGRRPEDQTEAAVPHGQVSGHTAGHSRGEGVDEVARTGNLGSPALEREGGRGLSCAGDGQEPSRPDPDRPDGGERTNEGSPPAEVQEGDAESGVVYLWGRPLSESVWREYKTDGTDPQVTEWARQYNEGEGMEAIARRSGVDLRIIKRRIGNRNLYFLACKNNGIAPHGGADV